MSSPQGGAASSFTDLMASLLALFVLLFVVAQNKRKVVAEDARTLLIRQLRGELQQAGIDSAAVNRDPRDPNSVVVVLPDSVLFGRGAAEMSPAGRNVVKLTTPGLTRILCASEMRNQLDQVVVEGHTDNTIPDRLSAEAGRRFNLRLSQLRSMDFVSRSTEALTGQDRELNCYLTLVSASGRGQEEPIPNIALDSAAQRRVLLRIRMRTDFGDTVKVVVPTSR
jgi:outer membrane protein OmpA-like peptidoglycan-associated protein